MAISWLNWGLLKYLTLKGAMRKTDIEIDVNHLIEANEIAVNAVNKHLAEISLAQRAYQMNTKKQKEQNWFRYINQLEN